MTKISIDDIFSGEKILFQINGFFIDTLSSPIFKVIAPSFPKLISKADKIEYTATDVTGKKDIAVDQLRYRAYRVKPFTSGPSKKTHVKLTLYVDLLQEGEVKKGDSLKYDTTNTTASYIMPDPTVPSYSRTGTVTKVNNGATFNGTPSTEIDLKIPKFPIVPAIPSLNTAEKRADGVPRSTGLSAVNIVYRTESKVVTTGKDFTIFIKDNEIKNNLTDRDTAKDLYVYAYVQSNNPITEKSVKKLFAKRDVLISPSASAPRYVDVRETGKSSIFPPPEIENGANSNMNRVLDSEGKNVQLYVAIARYTYNGSSWDADWLQKDENGNAIWGRVAKK
jgi:hypothetical protein